METIKSNLDKAQKDKKKIEEIYLKKERSLKNELGKRDSEIENLKAKINSLSSTAQNPKNTRSDLSKSNFTVINDHVIKSELEKKNGLYSGAKQDFNEFTQNEYTEGFNNLQKENTLLREALRDLQTMISEVAEHRHQIVNKAYRKDFDMQTPPILKELKAELFNLNGSSLSSSTLTEMRDNISKFKLYMQKLDTLSIPGTGSDATGARVPFQGLEQIPKSSV
jgi:hypothetical protein